jgi:hypothetical protein
MPWHVAHVSLKISSPLASVGKACDNDVAGGEPWAAWTMGALITHAHSTVAAHDSAIRALQADLFTRVLRNTTLAQARRHS